MDVQKLIRLHELALTYLKLIQNLNDQLDIMRMNNDSFGIGFHETEIASAEKEIERMRVMYLKTVYELQHFEYGQDVI
jgi:hypothetical protein